MTDILNNLNTPQQQAVTTTEGPVMVIAGAGSGKTRVLTYRVAYLLSIGIAPYNILALTFTNKAAREMRDRVASLIDTSKAKSLWMGTFHSIFARLLRAEAPKIDYPSNFTIYDTDDTKRLIRHIIKEQQLDDKTYSPAYVLSRISHAKNNLISADAYKEDFEIQTQDIQSRKPKLGLLYSIYQQRLRKASAMDFDDLLFNTNVLLRDFPEVLYKYQQRFSYILVDEYQDTNYSQYLIVKKLAANNENICVVGDDAQSIYAFRGANIQNILNFKKDYPEYKLFKLEQNYRSTQHIVNAANGVIANNKDQIYKKVWTSNEAGEKVHVVKTANEGDEASWLSSRIFGIQANNQLPYSSFAILYRTNAQSRALEEALRRMNIPYRIFGGISFYQRKEIKDVLAYFRLIINPMDEDAFLRIINFPARGLGQTTVGRLLAVANDTGKPLWEVACNPSEYNAGLNAGARSKLEQFVILIKGFGALLFKLNAFELGEKVLNQAGIRKFYFEDGSAESINRRENIEELLSGLKEFVTAGSEGEEGEGGEGEGEHTMRTLDEFMQDIALLTDVDVQEKRQNNKSDDSNKVSLMTIHAAKGLEFPYVFIAGAEENLFPSIMSIGSREELEEERRLFYVALTRAMKLATITYAETRFRYGNFTFCEPSRFIDELDTEHTNYLAGPGMKKVQSQHVDDFGNGLARFKKLGHANQSNNKPDNISSQQRINQPPPLQTNNNPSPEAGQTDFLILTPDVLHINATVQHQRFGVGTVIGLEGGGQNAKATVLFNSFGKKQLLLKFARLKLLSQ
jgi:DNA helicase II / ATP-dependent DNA helicase PcrA